MSNGVIISIGGEVDTAHFIDEDQAEAQKIGRASCRERV
jgi:hypothetical protein